MSDLNTEIQYLKGVGPKRAELLAGELGIRTLGDLLSFYPFRYIDRSTILPIASVQPDMAYVQVRGRVVSANLVPRKRFNAVVEDGSGRMSVAFFRGLKWVSEKLTVGSEFLFFGKPTMFNGQLNFTHPEIDPAPPVTEVPAAGGAMGGATTGGTGAVNGGVTAMAGGTMTGVYPSTEKLRNAGFTGRVMNKIMKTALDEVLYAVPETLPDHILKAKDLVDAKFAVKNIHFPFDGNALAKAKYRLKFEELFYLQLSLLKQKYIRRHNEEGIPMPKVGPAFNALYNSLPYELTGAQKRVIREIREDMRSGRQMNRLLQGDVGSGKTMVAVLCALIAVGNGYQACIMAPTEVLARQHFANISKYLEPTGVRPAILTGCSKVGERREIAAGLQDGSIGIIVGTHALIEDTVVLKNLGLDVIDEKHRFGVEQRSRLWSKSDIPPHVLVMTATPIPRTLAMTLYGDLDISVIDEMPPGRKPVETIHATEGKRPAMYKFIRGQIATGRQIFIVYPLIFESEKLDYKNLEEGIE
ncbi:MAG: ATP-dependent DNA helicase RecG, partial [Bacteroidales bacterium]|nr:ATP-dependent DNA helicase RecG [Bacteroidales bacterium]